MRPSLATLTDPAAIPSRILLIGMMGSGKSLVGSLVAPRLGWLHLDTDELVQERTGKTIARLFAEEGEAAFRAEEAQALAGAVTGREPVVVAVAGGAVLTVDNRHLLRRAGLVVWLRAGLPTLAHRVVGGEHRPLLAGDRLDRLTQLYAERRPHYQELADLVIDVDHLTPDEVAEQVVAAFHTARDRAVESSAPGGGGRRA
ncbi:MAG: shikimate kinase [Actinomycetota bacterium]|nr:shikimate kinase [Actinomycetota bacterium]